MLYIKQKKLKRLIYNMHLENGNETIFVDNNIIIRFYFACISLFYFYGELLIACHIWDLLIETVGIVDRDTIQFIFKSMPILSQYFGSVLGNNSNI